MTTNRVTLSFLMDSDCVVKDMTMKDFVVMILEHELDAYGITIKIEEEV